jgi:pilus assembly protein Flp/PilA
VKGEWEMRNLIAKFGREEDGAAMVEYTVLLGIITVATIATIILVGGWVSGKWGELNAALPAIATPGGGGSGTP